MKNFKTKNFLEPRIDFPQIAKFSKTHDWEGALLDNIPIGLGKIDDKFYIYE